MSKLISGLRTARECYMSMSAQILRSFVLECFNVSPREVILSGVMPETFNLEENHSSGSMYCCDVNHEVYAFEPTTGFVEVSSDMSARSSNGNGSWNNEKRTTFEHMYEYSSALFFVVLENNRVRQEGSQDVDERKVTLYKAPNFKAIFASIEEADVNRWASWLQ